VITELDRVLAGRPDIDYITFAGSGEPTLSLSLGHVIGYIKTRYPHYPVAILTNGSLCWQAAVRGDLRQADLIIPTLTTACQQSFDCIHRPAPGLFVQNIINGLVTLRKGFSHQIWLEVFLVPPLNTTAGELDGIRDLIRRIRPDRVQLNTLDRPGTESWVSAVDQCGIEQIKAYLEGGGTPVEVITACQPCAIIRGSPDVLISRIEETVKRRPCTADDLARITGFQRNLTLKCLADLIKQRRVHTTRGPRGIFYHISGDEREEKDKG
jgi:wyosine [tRNA(Phe)-imidazoG37] synthetase (radical SAM superfamily)